MFPSNRFSFGQPTDGVAQKVFQNSYELKITMSRGKGDMGPYLLYTLEGSMESEDGDVGLLQTAKSLLDAFQQLGRFPSKTDDCEDCDECDN
ncbi:MAG: hypothetical protein ACYC6N_18830 [Pirellulaceae bacterium]